MTTVCKVTVSLPKEILMRARRLIGKKGNLSAYLAGAVEQRIHDDDLKELLDEMLAKTGGPMTEEEKRWVDDIFDGRVGKFPVKRRKVA